MSDSYSYWRDWFFTFPCRAAFLCAVVASWIFPTPWWVLAVMCLLIAVYNIEYLLVSYGLRSDQELIDALECEE